MLIRRLARPMLSAIFINAGVNELRNVEQHVKVGAPLIEKVRPSLPDQLPSEPAALVRIDAGVKIVAGLALALGKFPRLASLLLAGGLVPTTLAGHRFWELDEPGERTSQQIHFFKNLGLLGGLILAAVDTEGRPSLGWWSRRAARRLAERTTELAEKVLPGD